MDWSKQNLIRDKVSEVEEFTIKDFANDYARMLQQYNMQYLDLKDTRDSIAKAVEYLQGQK